MKKNIIEILLSLIKIANIFKKITFFIIFDLIWRVGRIFLRFIFYKIVVKVYSFYLLLSKQIGWPSLKRKSFSYILGQKLIHIALVFITIFFVFVNLSNKTKALGTSINNYKPILVSLLENEFSNPDEEQLIEEFFDQETIISPVQQNYLDNLSVVRSQPMADVKQFEDEDSRVIDTSKIDGSEKRTAIVEYIIEEGDSISSIASKFNIDVSTVLWENNLSGNSVIKPGQKLDILPISGISYNITKGDTLLAIANKYDINEDEIININNLSDPGSLRVGQKLLIPGGKKIITLAKKSTYSNPSNIKNLINILPSGQPIGDQMLWPTVGHRLTQYYSWVHRGLDIANKVGTPLYAAETGVVEVAGWGKGYGNQVVINHGGGKKTRYGHASKLYVVVGEKVKKGDIIATMGSTGWSTGPHIHFEVIINNVKYNPLNYIK